MCSFVPVAMEPTDAIDLLQDRRRLAANQRPLPKIVGKGSRVQGVSEEGSEMLLMRARR